MATLAELTAWRDSLIQARARGIREVQVADRKTTYASDKEMASAIADLERRISAASGTKRATMIRFTTSKGV